MRDLASFFLKQRLNHCLLQAVTPPTVESGMLFLSDWREAFEDTAWFGTEEAVVVVLLNSPSTRPTRPFLGGLTGDGNVKIVYPGC